MIAGGQYLLLVLLLQTVNQLFSHWTPNCGKLGAYTQEMKGQPQCELETLFLATPVGNTYNHLQPDMPVRVRDSQARFNWKGSAAAESRIH
jgi:hypothetical protein